MNDKENSLLVRLARVIDSLDQDIFYKLLEQQNHLILATLLFSLLACKSGTQRLLEQLLQILLKKIDQRLPAKSRCNWDLTWTVDKSKDLSDQVIKSVIEADYGQQTKVMAKTLPSTFQVQISQNHSQLVTCAQQDYQGMLKHLPQNGLQHH